MYEELDESAGKSTRSADYEVECDDEWEQIKALPLIDLSQQKDNLNRDHSVATLRVTSCVNLDEVLEYFESIPITQHLPRIQPVQSRTGLYNILSQIFCLNRPNLDLSLVDERNRLFATALQSFENQDSMQTRFLVTIYQKLTGNALVDCRRFGNHWEDIGFQGTDPATDLRGVGLLGLLQILFLILSTETSHLCKEIYKLSLDKRQHFPFAVMSLQISSISLQVLREGLLNKQCNEAKCVLKVFNWFYSGVFYKLYITWRDHNKTIVDSGYVLKELRKTVRKNVKQVIVDVLSYKNELETKSTDKPNEDDITFSNLGDMFAELEEYKPS